MTRQYSYVGRFNSQLVGGMWGSMFCACLWVRACTQAFQLSSAVSSLAVSIFLREDIHVCEFVSIYVLFLIKVVRVYKMWIPLLSPVSLQVPRHREPPFHLTFSESLNVFLTFDFNSALSPSLISKQRCRIEPFIVVIKTKDISLSVTAAHGLDAHAHGFPGADGSGGLCLLLLLVFSLVFLAVKIKTWTLD